MENLVKITLHGDLGSAIGENWNLSVSSVSEAVHAIEINTKKLYKYLLRQDKKGAKYRVLINGEDFICDKKGILKPNDLEYIQNSELVIKKKNLKTIDIVPILEGTDSSFFGTITAILGVVLIIAGFLIPGPWGIALVMAGLGLLAAGVTSLLSRPPKFAPFQQAPNGQISYLFSGPTNTTREGGPVPIGYGRLIIGSQVISASYIIKDYNVTDNNIVAISTPYNNNSSILVGGNDQIFLGNDYGFSGPGPHYDTYYTYDQFIIDNTNKYNNLTQSYQSLQSGANPTQTTTQGTDVNVNIINRN